MSSRRFNPVVLLLTGISLMIGMVFSAPDKGQVWSEVVQVSYALSLNDSRNEALEIVRDMARKEAASRAGTYIQGQTRLEEGVLTESIQALSASIVSLQNESHQFEIAPGAPNGRLVYSAKAVVDQSVMQKRIEAINRDQKLAQNLFALSRENKLLTQELERLQALIKDANNTELREVLNRRSLLKDQLDWNRETMTGLFAGKSLLDMKESLNVVLETRKNELRRDFLEPLLNLPVTADVVYVGDENGKTRVDVKVAWGEISNDILDPLFLYLKGEPYAEAVRYLPGFNRFSSLVPLSKINIFRQAVLDVDAPHVHAQALYSWLERFFIEAEVAVGSQKKTLPIFGAYNYSGSGPCYPYERCWGASALAKRKQSGISSDEKIAFWKSSDRSARQILTFIVSNEEAARITAVDAKIKLTEL